MPRQIEITKASAVLRPIAFEQFLNPQMRPQTVQLEDIQAEANRILESARLEAENLKRAASEEGYQAGFAQGHEAGLNEFHERVEKLERLLGGISESISEAKCELFEDIEGELIELVIALTEKVVYKEIEDSQTIQNLVKKALQLVGEEKRIVIHLHPDDLDLIKENGFQEEDTCLSLIPDADIERGGCFVEAGKKVVDARLETRLGEMVEALYDKS